MYNVEYRAIQPPFVGCSSSWIDVTTVTITAISKASIAKNTNVRPRARANFLPTELFFSQWGHRASWLTSELNKKVSPQ